ncbi:MAG: hypothetical protein WHS46_01890 [Desulfosoma sp.]
MRFSQRLHDRGRVLRVVLGWMLLGILVSCATGPDFQRSRPVQLSPMEVISWRPYEPYAFRRLCVVPFEEPQGMEGLGRSLADTYRQVLTQEQVFSAPSMSASKQHGSMEHFDTNGVPDPCDLVLTGTVDHIHVGSGALPTVLGVTVRIVDARHKTCLWEVIQEARSFPSPDVDLFWHVISGPGSADHRKTARYLAWQLAFFLKGDKETGTAGQEAPGVEGG